jgi:hypothetical protein
LVDHRVVVEHRGALAVLEVVGLDLFHHFCGLVELAVVLFCELGKVLVGYLVLMVLLGLVLKVLGWLGKLRRLVVSVIRPVLAVLQR